MNFGVFAQSLKKSAAMAAEAAQKLDFDKMAAEDDYIHTDTNVVPRQRSPVEYPMVDDASTLSTHSSLVRVPDSARFPRTKRTLVPLKVDVPERQPKIPEDSLSSDDDEDEEDDPIMKLLKKEAPRAEEPPTSGSVSTPLQKHRFFEDLESRIALPEKEFPTVPLSQEPGADRETSDVQPLLPKWFSSATSALGIQKSKLETVQRGITRPAFFRKKSDPIRDELSNVAVVSGAAVLGEAELEELAAFGKRQEQNYIHFLMGLIQHHPRELFILFTLFLGGFMYLFVKNRSWSI